MSIEDYSPDIDASEGGASGAESTKEVSEKFKEQVKKSGVGVKRTKKDEKKAKKQDLFLANFLVKIIIAKKYDELFDSLFSAMNSGCPSNFLLGILSLIDIEISNKIRELSSKHKIDFEYTILTETQEFDDNNIDIAIKKRINFWVEDMVDIVSIEYSSVMTKKFMKKMKNNDEVTLFMSGVFSFFLKNLNISISAEKSQNICEFIFSEVISVIKKLETEKI